MADQGPPSPCSSPKLSEYLENCDMSSCLRSHKPFGRSKDKTLDYIFSKSLRHEGVNNLPTSSNFTSIMKICDLPPFFKNTQHSEPLRSPEDSGLSLPCNSVKSVKIADGISLYPSPESLKKSEDGNPLSSYRSPRSSAGLELTTSSPCKCRQLSSPTPSSCCYGLPKNCDNNISPVSSCSNKSLGCNESSLPSCDSNQVCWIKPLPDRETCEKKRKMLKCRCVQKYKIWCNHLKERKKISKKIMKKTGKTYCSLLLNSLNQNRRKLCPNKFPQQRCVSPTSTQRDETIKLYMDNSCVDNLDADAKKFSEVAQKLYQNLDECRRKKARTCIIKFLSDILFSQYSES